MMFNEQTKPLCPDCVNLRKALEEVTIERNNLRRQITGRAAREGDLAGIKERLMGLEMHMKGLTAHLAQIFERLAALEKNAHSAADVWAGINSGSLGASNIGRAVPVTQVDTGGQYGDAT
jgi:hypothetical protein